MNTAAKLSRKSHVWELCRFAVNGIVATGINFLLLSLLVHFHVFNWVALSGAVANAIGIASAFVGSRFFVYRQRSPYNRIRTDLIRFLLLYGGTGGLHVALLALWCDVYGGGINKGFIIATAVQTGANYAGGKWFVFR